MATSTLALMLGGAAAYVVKSFYTDNQKLFPQESGALTMHMEQQQQGPGTVQKQMGDASSWIQFHTDKLRNQWRYPNIDMETDREFKLPENVYGVADMMRFQPQYPIRSGRYDQRNDYYKETPTETKKLIDGVVYNRGMFPGNSELHRGFKDANEAYKYRVTKMFHEPYYTLDPLRWKVDIDSFAGQDMMTINEWPDELKYVQAKFPEHWIR